VQEQGWTSVQNGQLLRIGSQTFDVLVTGDKNLQYQQDVSKINIGIVVLASSDTRLPSLRQLFPQIRDAIATVAPGTVVRIPPLK
jgi:hypothetical protein